jgi:hypothetical protein
VAPGHASHANTEEAIDGGQGEEEQHALEEMDTSTESVTAWDSANQAEAVPALIALVEKDQRRSTFTFTFDEHNIDISETDKSVNMPEGLSVPTAEAVAEKEDQPLLPVTFTDDSLSTFLADTPELQDTVHSQRSVAHTAKPDAAELAPSEPVDDSLDSLLMDAREFVESADTRKTNEDYEGNEEFEDPDDADLEDMQLSSDLVHITAKSVETMADNGEVLSAPTMGPAEIEVEDEAEVEMSEVTLDLDEFSIGTEGLTSDAAMENGASSSPEDFTEASMQLELQRDTKPTPPAEEANAIPAKEEQQVFAAENLADDDDLATDMSVVREEASSSQSDVITKSPANDMTSQPSTNIADGLTLSTPKTSTTESPSLTRRAPTPPPFDLDADDATSTMYLDDDTAVLKEFLNRAAASKASKAITIARRTSLQNRRDSDAVRQALASPRTILEDKDPNSPTKYDNDITMDLSQTLTLNLNQQPPLSPTIGQADAEEMEQDKASKSSRRSSRTRKSRLPAPASVAQQIQGPKSIAVRRAEGEPIVLKRTEAQELGQLTRNNTRKNKQGAFSVNLRLLKLKADAVSAPVQDETSSAISLKETADGKRNVKWDETLAYYQEGTDTVANMIADAQSLATPDELSVSLTIPSDKKQNKQEGDKKSEMPRVRKMRGLGSKNGTPGKGLLAPASLLPEGIEEEKEAEVEKPQRLPKASKLKKPAVTKPSNDTTPTDVQPPALEVAPIAIEPTRSPIKDTKTIKERKSRLATPRRVKLPQPMSAIPTLPVPLQGKENQTQSLLGIKAASPRKGLKLPDVIVPPSVESGLPRRRPTRKV